MEETMKQMNEDQKLKEKSAAMLGYFKQIYAADAKKTKKNAIGASMKKHPAYAHRMFGGDKNSPFHVSNALHHAVEHSLTSKDYGSHTRGVPRASKRGGGGDKADKLKAHLVPNHLTGSKEKDPALKIFAGLGQQKK
jgi:hypothetical protein